MIVSCDCGARLKIDDTKIAGRRVKIRCPRCGNVLPLNQPALVAPAPVAKKATQPDPSWSGILVLVAHDSEVVRNMVAGVLTEAGFRVELVSNGVDALKKATELKPQGLVLDVGLPGIYGFELCERLKGNPATKDIKIILLSSVYDRRRYKRTPASLYGADDYIEKHHIPDFLTIKMRNLISLQKPAKIAPKTAAPLRHELPEMSRPPAREFEPSLLNHEVVRSVDRDFRDSAPQNATVSPVARADSSEMMAVMPESLSLDASIFQKEECDLPGVDEADPEAVEKARRFARIIVSDIALYNQEAVIEGIRNGTFFELLKNDVEEGRELFEKRIPAVIRAKKDYYQEAFDNFINAAKIKNVTK
ncbi:MAG TPA: response regulator [Nitrospirota bacterium]|nr:response regulator [Nitrospirota bacterium]